VGEGLNRRRVGLVQLPVKSGIPVGSFWWVILIAAQLAALLPVSAADENAVIPYKEIDRLWAFVSAVNPTNLTARVSVTSTNPAVSPSEIKMIVQTAIGPAMVAVSTDGEIRRFPHDPELLRQNPPVVSNQPRGSLRLTLTWRLPLADFLGFRYSRLQDGVAEVNKAIKAQAGLMSAVSPQASGVIFVFPNASAGKAKVEIVSATDRKEYVADARGQVRLELDKARAAASVEVRLSEKAQLIIPDVN
jgi:hypothetical protein